MGNVLWAKNDYTLKFTKVINKLRPKLDIIPL